MAHDVRKTVTVVFCDVSGSTSMGEQLDPETLRRVMGRYFDEMRSVLERHGGTVEKFIGDAVMAVFGIPTVHEDDALRAVRAASEMRKALRELNKELERDHGVVIASRMGVNTGEVVAGGDDLAGASTLVTGNAVNVAARLEQVAAPGQILIGATTLSLVQDAVAVEPIDALALKGKAEPTPAFELVEVAAGAPGVARHLEAPLVGRVAEMNALEDALDTASRDRRAVLATVMAPPGVGKSRLVDEFVSTHAAHVAVVQGRCLSYGDGITYWPIVEILTAAAGIADLDGPEEIRAKIGLLLDGSDDAAVVVERLAGFLGLAGATAAPEETHWAIRKLLEVLASSRPLIAVFEDVHWAEPALLDLIEQVVAWSAGAPILVLCTARPELLEERHDWGAGADGAVALALEPLTPGESDRLVANLIGPTALPAEAEPLLDAAEGNPLFLEQLMGMLIDEGHLRRDGDAWVTTGDLSALSIPPTITGILESRLERLPASERDVLERGSIEGRAFHWSSVTALSPSAEAADVGRDLLSLVRRGLIGPTPAQFGGGEAFRFRHALIRDAAYARLPKATRAELHEQHARWLERTAGDRVAEFEDFLAYHLEQAARLQAELGPLDDVGRALADEAARLLASAGLRADSRGDLAAATTLLDRALGLLDANDPDRPALLVRYGRIVNERGNPERAATVLDEAETSAARGGDRSVELQARVLRAQVEVSLHPEGATEALALVVPDAISELEELDDDPGLVIAWLAAGFVALIHGRAAEMERAFGRAADYAERADDQANLSEAISLLMGITIVGPDRPEETLVKIPRLRERTPNDRKVEAMASFCEAVAMGAQGRFEDARERYPHGFRVLDDLGARMMSAGMRYYSGWIELAAGDLAAAERELREGFDTLHSMGDLGYLSTVAAVLGEALYRQDRLEEADQMAETARQAGASDDLSTQWNWRSVRAKVLARRGAFDQAIAFAAEAAAITGSSDFMTDRAASLMDQAEVCRMAGRTEDATMALREALEVAEAKGLVPLIEQITARLADLDNP